MAFYSGSHYHHLEKVSKETKFHRYAQRCREIASKIGVDPGSMYAITEFPDFQGPDAVAHGGELEADRTHCDPEVCNPIRQKHAEHNAAFEAVSARGIASKTTVIYFDLLSAESSGPDRVVHQLESANQLIDRWYSSRRDAWIPTPVVLSGGFIRNEATSKKTGGSGDRRKVDLERISEFLLPFCGFLYIGTDHGDESRADGGGGFVEFGSNPLASRILGRCISPDSNPANTSHCLLELSEHLRKGKDGRTELAFRGQTAKEFSYQSREKHKSAILGRLLDLGDDSKPKAGHLSITPVCFCHNLHALKMYDVPAAVDLPHESHASCYGGAAVSAIIPPLLRLQTNNAGQVSVHVDVARATDCKGYADNKFPRSDKPQIRVMLANAADGLGDVPKWFVLRDLEGPNSGSPEKKPAFCPVWPDGIPIVLGDLAVERDGPGMARVNAIAPFDEFVHAAAAVRSVFASTAHDRGAKARAAEVREEVPEELSSWWLQAFVEPIEPHDRGFEAADGSHVWEPSNPLQLTHEQARALLGDAARLPMKDMPE